MGHSQSRTSQVKRIRAEATASPPSAPVETGPIWVFDDPQFRERKLTENFSVAGSSQQLGVGHFGVVRLGERIADGAKVAIKSVPKKRQAYVDMLKAEISILRSARTGFKYCCHRNLTLRIKQAIQSLPYRATLRCL